MDKTALLLAGPIISAIGLYFQLKRKSISSWMNERRIDAKDRREGAICSECGAKMKRRMTYTGERKGMNPLVCSNYPECRNIKWD